MFCLDSTDRSAQTKNRIRPKPLENIYIYIIGSSKQTHALLSPSSSEHARYFSILADWWIAHSNNNNVNNNDKNNNNEAKKNRKKKQMGGKETKCN